MLICLAPLTESRWNRTLTTVPGGTSVFVTREQRTVVEEPEAGEMDPVALPSSRSALPSNSGMASEPKNPAIAFESSTTFAAPGQTQTHANTRLRSAASENAEHAALTRLAYDLTMSLPLIIFMSFAFPLLTILGTFLDQSKWAVRELAFDGFSWSAVSQDALLVEVIAHKRSLQIVTSLIIVGFFLGNIILNTGRYSLSGSHGKTIGATRILTYRASRASRSECVTWPVQGSSKSCRLSRQGQSKSRYRTSIWSMIPQTQSLVMSMRRRSGEI